MSLRVIEWRAPVCVRVCVCVCVNLQSILALQQRKNITTNTLNVELAVPDRA